ncbi:MAG TPA: CerR family C-terminal domain-containing protein [Pyrinomonadaceae bacterium]|jgi:TetR/AcrR family transcriptional regulator, regulator of cefoperazone and chloramphenicol sensitivity|nr:CerR family C-terminal domain-containing protein [Pyrinomonadaceae bacterium]
MTSRRIAKRRKSRTGLPVASERTRGRLIDAAGEMFAELGFHHATIRQICERAGVNIAAVNYHFRDKTGLYTEVVRQSMRAARLDAVQAAFDQHAPPEGIMRAAIKARLESLRGLDLSDWHFRIFAHELAKPTPAINVVINEAIRPLYLRMCRLIGSILGLQPDDQKTRLCAHSVIGQILFYAYARPVINRLAPEIKMTAAQVDLIANHITEFSLAYIGNAKPARKKR